MGGGGWGDAVRVSDFFLQRIQIKKYERVGGGGRESDFFYKESKSKLKKKKQFFYIYNE